MGIIARWNGVGLPAGTAITNATAGPGDVAFTAVTGQAFTVASGPVPRIQLAHQGGTTPALVWGAAVLGTGLAEYAFRFYVELSALPSASFALVSGWSGDDTARVWKVEVAGTDAGPTAGQVRLRDGADGQVASSGTAVLQAGVEYRVEIAATADSLMVNVYPGESLSAHMSVAGPVDGVVDAVRFGPAAASPLVPTCLWRGFAASDVGAEIGPSGGGPPSLSLWTGTVEVPLHVGDGRYVALGGGSVLRIPDGDVTTQGLRIEIPAGDRTTAGAPDTLAFYFNAGTDAAPDWRRTSWANEYGEWRIQPSRWNRVAFRIKQYTGVPQTGDLTQWTDVANVVLARVGPDGSGHFPTLTVGDAQVGTAHDWEPADYGLKGWAGDIGKTAGALAVSGGIVYMWRIKLPKPTTINNVVLHLAGAPALTAGQNFVGLYDLNGTRLAVSADQSAAWATPGTKFCALDTPVQVTAGFIYAAALFNGTTLPNTARFGQSTVYANLGQPQKRFGQWGAGVTELPTSIPIGSLADATPAALWVGLS